MCGIIGGVNFNIPKKMSVSEWIDRGLMLLKNRGPDSQGKFILDNCGIGGTRLRIFDNSSNADQPFFSQNKRYTIIYNGALLNYLDLKKKLEKTGKKFYTNSDTEVLIECISEWGLKKSIKIFRGMFAFAIVDSLKKEIILARDKFGIRPLYFYKNKNIFIFSSLIKTLLLHPETTRKVNKKVLPEFFGFQNIVPPNTIFKDIYSLNPGSFMKIPLRKNSRKIRHQYWKPEDFFSKRNNKKLNFFKLLCENTKKSWLGDRNKGLQLSGGVDSSLICAISQSLEEIKKKNTFSIIFNDKKNKISQAKSEKRYIDYVTKKFRLSTNYFEVKNEEISKVLDEAIYANEMPLYSANSAIQYLHGKKLKNKVHILLNGEGADDFFLGYFDQRKIKDDLDSGIQMYLNKPHINSLFGKTGYEKSIKARRNIWKSLTNKKINYKKKIIILTVKTVLHGLLSRHDKMYMENSIEGRPVFCDDKIFDSCLQMKTDEIHKYNTSKIKLKKISENFYHKKFIYRKKQWLAGPIADWISNEKIWGKYLKQINFKILKKYFNTQIFFEILNLNNKNKWSGKNLALIFSILNFDRWHKLYIENTRFNLK